MDATEWELAFWRQVAGEQLATAWNAVLDAENERFNMLSMIMFNKKKHELTLRETAQVNDEYTLLAAERLREHRRKTS